MSIELKEKITDLKRRIDVDSRHAIQHIGYKNWDIISKNIGLDLDLWRVLFEAGKTDTLHNQPDQSKHHLYCGEENYLSIRVDLEKRGIVGLSLTPTVSTITSQGKIKKKKETNKADKIKQDNIVRKIKIDVEELLKVTTLIPLLTDQIITFNYKFEELILVRMMIQCRNLIQKFKQILSLYNTKSASNYTNVKELAEIENEKNMYYNELVELIIGYNKIYNEKQKDNLISTTCLADLARWISQAKQIINFNAIEIITKIPELIFKTCYDDMLKHKQIDLYPSQKEIRDFVFNNDKFLALVHTMMAAGKTSMVLPLCKWLTAFKGKTKLIYCCPNEIVLLEVARMVYGLAIPFAIVIYNKEFNGIDYKWSTFADKINPKETAILYLCDVYSARILLEERNKCIKNRTEYLMSNRRDPFNNPLTEKRIPTIPDYILMGDELTKDADSQNNFSVKTDFSLTTEIFVDLMKLAPPKIILMSATLPTMDQLPDFYQAIVNNNPGMVVKSFASVEAKIGCALVSKTGELYAPHSSCENIVDIQNILGTIKSNPFIGRFYTFQVLLTMIETWKELELPFADLSELYNDPNKANQSNIQQTAYWLLEQLIICKSDELVKKACIMKKHVEKPINLSTIFTNDIGRFNRSCLIFSSDPIATAYSVYQENFDKFLTTKSDLNIFQQVKIDNILSNYEKEMDLFEKALERIQPKSNETFNRQSNEMDKMKNMGNRNVNLRVKSSKTQKGRSDAPEKISKMMEQKPEWKFPPQLVLCSEAHLKKSHVEKNIPLMGYVTPEDLPKTSSVPTDILTMLASGIGIYSTTCPQLDEEYLQCVISLAKKGIVKFIFTDSSIAYGTNLAVTDIVIVDEPVISTNGNIIPSIVDQHSIKTVFQMLGRAGRGGNLSYEARIYTTSNDNNMINIINSYSKGTLEEGDRDEIKNIRKAFQLLW